MVNLPHSIVAVHGLASDPNTAWNWWHPEQAPDQPMWLRDFLPEAGLHARIMTFNHNTAWQAQALDKSLHDFGKDLLRALHNVRTRPDVRLPYWYTEKNRLECTGKEASGCLYRS